MPGADSRSTTDLPFTTVVIPVRNGAAMIGDAISSVLAGDFPPERREILVVDNGSTDETAEVIRRHPVTYVHEPRPGVSNARNRGIAEGRGEVFAFIDGDCLASPEWLRELVAPFSDPDVGCVAGELSHAPGDTVAERQSTRMLGAWQQYAVNSNPPYAITANAAYRRSVFESIGPFDPRMPRAQDVELGLRFSERSDLHMTYSAKGIVSHRHRSTQRGFFRQQIGWSYGAGLVAAKYHALDGRPSPPPRLIDVWQQLRGSPRRPRTPVPARASRAVQTRLPRGRLVQPDAPGRLVLRSPRRDVARRPGLLGRGGGAGRARWPGVPGAAGAGHHASATRAFRPRRPLRAA